jgi:hypothetical protein
LADHNKSDVRDRQHLFLAFSKAYKLLRLLVDKVHRRNME